MNGLKCIVRIKDFFEEKQKFIGILLEDFEAEMKREMLGKYFFASKGRRNS